MTHTPFCNLRVALMHMSEISGASNADKFKVRLYPAIQQDPNLQMAYQINI